MKISLRRTVALATAAIGLSLSAGVANATVLQYQLNNHPDGSARPPAYGFRLDELYNATASHDVFTFDFDHASSSMMMDIDLTAGTIRLFGQAFGGRDIGTGYANDQYLGVYSIDMIYTTGVSVVPGDTDDIWSTADSMTAAGSISTPANDTIPLTNKNMGGYSFRFGNEDNDAGHRGFDGLSGWGWVNHGDLSEHVNSSDWLFTASPRVPTPGTAALAAVGLGLVGTSRRRRK